MDWPNIFSRDMSRRSWRSAPVPPRSGKDEMIVSAAQGKWVHRLRRRGVRLRDRRTRSRADRPAGITSRVRRQRRRHCSDEPERYADTPQQQARLAIPNWAKYSERAGAEPIDEQVLGSGTRINFMAFARGHRTNWHYFATKSREPVWVMPQYSGSINGLKTGRTATNASRRRGIRGPLRVPSAPDRGPLAIAAIDAS